jgi:hypothetical protein
MMLTAGGAAALGAAAIDLSGTECEEEVQVASQGELVRSIALRAKQIGHPPVSTP